MNAMNASPRPCQLELQRLWQLPGSAQRLGTQDFLLQRYNRNLGHASSIARSFGSSNHSKISQFLPLPTLAKALLIPFRFTFPMLAVKPWHGSGRFARSEKVSPSGPKANMSPFSFIDSAAEQQPCTSATWAEGIWNWCGLTFMIKLYVSANSWFASSDEGRTAFFSLGHQCIRMLVYEVPAAVHMDWAKYKPYLWSYMNSVTTDTPFAVSNVLTQRWVLYLLRIAGLVKGASKLSRFSLTWLN